MTRGVLGFCGLAVIALFGCGAAPHTRDAGGISPLAIRAVEWNPTHADVGRVTAVADVEEDVVVFGDGVASVFSSGALLTADHSVKKWVDAATIPAADGGASWIVGIDGDGKVRRLRGRASFEPVSERYGLGADHVRAVSAFGGKYVGFLLDKDLGVSDGATVTRFSGGPLLGLAGGGGIAAAFDATEIHRIDAEKKTTQLFALEGVSQVAVDAHGHVFATTKDGVFAETDNGELALRFRSARGEVHGLAVSGARVWFADGSELGVIEGNAVSASTGAKLSPGAHLVGSASGDVWAIDDGKLQRFAKADATSGAAGAGTRGPVPSWDESIHPLFARACASCHTYGGASGIDLSTQSAWQTRIKALRERVVVTKTMPPRGHPLSDAEREVIRSWIDAQK